MQIQKVLLEANNKLILSTLDNIGFAYCMIRDYEAGSQVGLPGTVLRSNSTFCHSPHFASNTDLQRVGQASTGVIWCSITKKLVTIPEKAHLLPNQIAPIRTCL